ncbi:MAG: YqjF family protein [Thermoanaerobaculia bacterium]
MLNYVVPPEVLAPFVPAGTELDTWEGKTFASMVGFLFLDTRVLGVAIPGHRNFEEVNLRFYVKRKAEDGWRRGVVFIKEIVPRAAIAGVARLLYGEKYVAMPMRHSIIGDPARGGMYVMYGWRFRGRWNGIGAVVSGSPKEAAPGSEEEFITEHYWGYSSRRGGGATEYRVDHPRWRVWPLLRPVLDCDVAALYGSRFAGPLAGEPSSAFLADGSEVSVSPGASSSRMSSSGLSRP